MKPVISRCTGACLLVVVSFVGCTRDSGKTPQQEKRPSNDGTKRSPDEVVEELIKSADKAVDAMSAIKDEAMAKEQKTHARILLLYTKPAGLHLQYRMLVAPGHKDHVDFPPDVRKKVDAAMDRLKNEKARYDKLVKAAEPKK